MKQLLATLLLLVSCLSSAQNFEDEWTGYFSYVSIKAISQGNDRLFAVAENAVFSFDLSTREINTISSVNGLSGELISSLYYSSNFNLLVIGYENGLIDIVIDGEENILKVVDILEKPTIPPNRKRINHFNEYNGSLYISTGFGISVYDLERLEFGDTYFIGELGTQISTSQTTISGEFIFASSDEGGIRRALVDNPNLINFEEWTPINLGSNWLGIQALGDQVYAMRVDDRLFEFIPGAGFVPVTDYASQVVDFGVQGDLLTVTTVAAIEAYSEGFVLEASVTNIPGFDVVGQSGYSFNNFFYYGTEEDGLLAIPFGTNQAEQILPDGPIDNRPYSLDAVPGELWVAFGEVDVNFNPFPLTNKGISHLKEGSWINFDFEAALETNDIVNVAINPADPTEVFMTSYNKGLLRIVDEQPFLRYDNTNTNLNSIDPNGTDVRLYGADFDRDGNLWVTQSREEEGLIRITPSLQFQKNDITDIIPNAATSGALGELRISREGYIFFTYDQDGLVAYNPSSGQFKLIEEGIGTGNLPDNNVRAIEFDNQNRLWIGSLMGLRVFFNVGGLFEEGANVDAQPIIILEDGVPQELLFELTVTDIEVDGSNNKWISTATSGVFYLSSNGQETLLRFTKSNSPLPSDNVQDIAIDPFTGVVYFATLNGLVAYNGSSTAPRENLEDVYSYPNPVRPGFEGNVTIDGLTARANVKITDLEGNLVFEETSQGGSVLWDTTAFGRYKVASGVYLVLITTDDALETKVHKIMIVR
ncbi:MAG: T9SS type A sorting domain-containing protein [Flavobacteriaceae bacterium]|nr:T9SS type A sorting domain-containing protein [Flavobacteriaceae bacterium]NNK54894.1 T9SS type A sorting domain-containing protein [Flavobacteriaceae bacterium]